MSLDSLQLYKVELRIALVHPTIWKSAWHPFFLMCVALVLSAFSLKYLPGPFIWISLIWAFALFAAIVYLRRPWSRVVVFLLLNASVTAVAFAAAEAYLSLQEAKPPIYSDGYRIKEDVLGFVPIKGIQAHSSRFERGVKLYDVAYTIDSKGLRVAPPVKHGGLAGCILFFGDSFTFGEGLQDQETLPYQVGIQSGGQYRTFNFGFHGYGPPQMLAAIEKDFVRHIVDCHPDYAIYQALPGHAARVVGESVLRKTCAALSA